MKTKHEKIQKEVYSGLVRPAYFLKNRRDCFPSELKTYHIERESRKLLPSEIEVYHRHFEREINKFFPYELEAPFIEREE